MKTKLILMIALLSAMTDVSSQTNRYKGVPNDVNILNMYWKNYREETKDMGSYIINGKKEIIEEIRSSISRNITNYSLSEYCLIIDYLLEKLDSCEKMRQDWVHYMDSLNMFSQSKAYRAGVVPLESQFFLATLNLNREELSKKYPIGYDFAANNTPPMYEYGYNPNDYGQILMEKGFTTPEDKGIMYDMLLIEDVRLIEVIKKNPELDLSFLMWLKTVVPSDLFQFVYSDDRVSEMFNRKIEYLRYLLMQSGEELCAYTAEQIDKIQIVHPHPIDKNSNWIVLSGAWKGDFGERVIDFRVSCDDDNLNPEHKLRGSSKFVGQNDRHLVPMTGTFIDKGDIIEVQMVEQPDTAAWNGVFNYIIERKTKRIKGTWVSNNKKLKREYVLEKLPSLLENMPDE